MLIAECHNFKTFSKSVWKICFYNKNSVSKHKQNNADETACFSLRGSFSETCYAPIIILLLVLVIVDIGMDRACNDDDYISIIKFN